MRSRSKLAGAEGQVSQGGDTVNKAFGIVKGMCRCPLMAQTLQTIDDLGLSLKVD